MKDWQFIAIIVVFLALMFGGVIYGVRLSNQNIKERAQTTCSTITEHVEVASANAYECLVVIGGEIYSVDLNK